ncbi:MAG: NADH-quinone oxidoreductase subunit D [Oligoflexia bacterium]|nr:NADH-quinone oxidoreductase subunit D [Oligoflexia bacterium]
MANFLSKQEAFNEMLKGHYALGMIESGSEKRQLEFDALNEPILWSHNGADLMTLLKGFRGHPNYKLDYLTDLTAYVHDVHHSFVVVYQIYSPSTHVRLRLKLLIREGEVVPSVTSLFASADWNEREVYDMFGIVFGNHPDLRRIMMDERFVGHPLRKDYDIKQRMPFPDNIMISMDRCPTNERGEFLPCENKESNSAPRESLFDVYNPSVLLNLGPSHPAMHGTLRVMCRINGETIEDAKCEPGYLHRAIEKLGETNTYHQWFVYTDRLNYCSALNNNIAYAMAVENLLGLTLPERAVWIRMMCMELSRIIDHLICVAINALDMGAMTIFWHLYRWREEAYTMIEGMCGMRLTTTYARIGGLSYDLYEGFHKDLAHFCDGMLRALDDMEVMLTRNRIWIDRTKGVGKLSAKQALALSATGPVLRASGVDIDLRRDRPYYFYEDVDFDVVIASNGDVFDRYLVRTEEMRQSVRLLRQFQARIKPGPIWVDNPQVRIPEKIDVYTKMEVLIHHFKIFMEGIDVPPGEAYTAVEGPNGELGFYIISRGGPKAWRLRIKSPSFMHYQLTEKTLAGERIPDAISILGSVNIVAGELDR